MRPIRLALALLGALALSGCAAALPWISVIAAGITLLGNTENDATQIILHERGEPAPSAPSAPAKP